MNNKQNLQNASLTLKGNVFSMKNTIWEEKPSSSNMANLINYDNLNGKHLVIFLQALAFFLLNYSDLYINIVYAFIDDTCIFTCI